MKTEKEHWVEIKLFDRWQRALVAKIKPDGKYICFTGFGCIAMSPKNVRELKRS